jgi:predicted Zn-dependent protease
MKNIFLKVVLICGILLSCSSENDILLDNGNNGNTNVSTNRQATGSSANDLLSADSFKKMIIEIAYIDGFKPSETAKNNFKNFINNRTFKPEGVEFIEKQIPSTGKTVYTLNEVVAIEKEFRTQYNTSSKIAVWVLFINGKSSKDDNQGSILGSAYWNTSFVIYEETIHGLSDSAFEPERSLLESSVINHEFGHILGLTNLGSNLQSDHEDAAHPKHCIEEDCLMYWAAENSKGITNMISRGQVPTLDAQCLADLKANGGK